ncbi:uncharacterized protein [Miscanthus floridulus]|uniref:uncharacterized protein n=1 Tax=Miscanthus floridulus TaxID=154761 RepID=UPI003458E60A
MSCFGAAMPTTTGGTYHYSSSSSGRPGGGRRPWRAKCVGIAAAVGSRLRRSVIGGVDVCRRRRTASSVHYSQSGWCHHHHQRSFAPVYVDDLYSHHQLQLPAAKALRGVVQQDEPSTSARDKLAMPAAAAPAHAAAASAAGSKATTASAGKQQQARAMAAGVGAMRNVLLRSPGRVGGGGVLGVVKGMGEVDLRAELFIRKFREDMRLQSQRSAEEFQAMLARGL